MFKRQSQADRDRELLSAYIDNRLDPAEHARVEARLAAEPALRAEAESLRQTVRAVRAMPRVSAPRNFTLDPRLYSRRKPSLLGRAFPALRLATAMTTLVLMMVLAGQIAVFNPIAGRAVPAAPAVPAAVTSAPVLSMTEATDATDTGAANSGPASGAPPGSRSRGPPSEPRANTAR